MTAASHTAATSGHPTWIRGCRPAVELAKVNLHRHDFHSDWNYTVSPTTTIVIKDAVIDAVVIAEVWSGSVWTL